MPPHNLGSISEWRLLSLRGDATSMVPNRFFLALYSNILTPLMNVSKHDAKGEQIIHEKRKIKGTPQKRSEICTSDPSHFVLFSAVIQELSIWGAYNQIHNICLTRTHLRSGLPHLFFPRVPAENHKWPKNASRPHLRELNSASIVEKMTI